MSKRPPWPIRYLVLLLAAVALLCAVCARGGSGTNETTPNPTTSQPQNQQANPPAGEIDAGPAQTQEPEQKPDFFPATKAPGYLFDGERRP